MGTMPEVTRGERRRWAAPVIVGLIYGNYH